jgi:hypothetical protein
MSGIAFIITTDGRGEFLERTIASWDQAQGEYVAKIILDDSGDAEYREWLEQTFTPQGWHIMWVGMTRQGYSAAMQNMRLIGITSGADYILHVEDDFVLNKPIDLHTITDIMNDNPQLAQMALVRQPWYANEIQFGGVIRALQDQGCNFDEKTNGEHYWQEHIAVWTANPNLMPIKVAHMEYPDGNWSEAAFMRKLREETLFVCAYYGKLEDEPMVTHIGDYKKGNGY